MTRSPLLDLPGMGEARFKKFKKAYPKGIGDATLEEIRQKAGLPEAVAKAVWAYYNGGSEL